MLSTIRQRLTDARTLKRLLEEAEQAASRDGLDVPGPEHLVVSAVALPDGTAARALVAAGMNPDGLEGAIRRAHNATLGVGSDDGPVRTPVPPRSTPYRMTDAGNAFLHEVHDVHTSVDGPLLGAHVVLAAADLDAGVWPRVLAAADVTPEQLRTAARAELGGSS